MHFLLHLFLPLSLLLSVSWMPFSLLFLFRLPLSRMQYGRQFTLRYLQVPEMCTPSPPEAPRPSGRYAYTVVLLAAALNRRCIS